MPVGLVIISIAFLLGALSHRHTRLENKIYKNVPLTEWIIIVFLPVSLYIGWVLLIKNILKRPPIDLFPLDDLDILAISIFCMLYGFVGNGIHFVSKILWRYLKHAPHTMAYRVNEMFHNRFSHYLTYLSTLLIAFLLPILEINHPLTDQITLLSFIGVIAFGLIFGVCGTKGVLFTNEWYGGYNKPLLIVLLVLTSLIITVIKSLKLNLFYYPIMLFVIGSFFSGIITLTLRGVFILSRLKSKKRLQFLSRLLSA